MGVGVGTGSGVVVVGIGVVDSSGVLGEAVV